MIARAAMLRGRRHLFEGGLLSNSAKGLEWPVVIPINTTTELYRSDQFVHRQSDNSLHWMLGGIAPPDLAAARVQDSEEEEARQRERIWYVACTRARDLLILPNIPQAKNNSWFKAIDLRREDVPELNLENLPSPPRALSTRDENRQSANVFSAEQEVFTASMPALVWRRPSDHDPDRLGDAADPVVVVETIDPRIEAVGGGAMRGVVLHKLMEELLTGELAGNEDEVTARVGALLLQLQMGRDHGQVLEMARTALRSWGLAEIEAIKPYLVPELAVWPSAEDAAVIHKAQGVDERSVERAAGFSRCRNTSLWPPA